MSKSSLLNLKIHKNILFKKTTFILVVLMLLKRFSR